MRILKSLVLAAVAASSFALAPNVFANDGAAEMTASVSAADFVGKPLYDVNGVRIAAVYRADEDGSAYVIVSSKMKTVPASTLSVQNDRLTTSLTRKEVSKSR